MTKKKSPTEKYIDSAVKKMADAAQPATLLNACTVNGPTFDASLADALSEIAKAAQANARAIEAAACSIRLQGWTGISITTE